MRVIFDDDEFDRVVHGSLPEHGPEHAAVVVKENATEGGNPLVCVTQVARAPDGTDYRFQTVFTARILIEVAAAVAGRFAHLGLGKPLEMEDDAPETLSETHRGVGWDAIRVPDAYVLAIENPRGGGVAQAVAKSRAAAKATAEQMIDEFLA